MTDFFEKYDAFKDAFNAAINGLAERFGNQMGIKE